MALTPQEQNLLLAHVNRTWKVHACQLCGVNNWVSHGVIQLSLTFTGGPALIAGGQGLPTAAMVCQNCGNTVFVNLVFAKVVPGVAK